MGTNGLIDVEKLKDSNRNMIYKNGNGKIDRYILPSPPDIPTTKYVPGKNELTLYWTNNSENSIDPISQKKDFAGYSIYVSRLGFDTEKKINLDSAWQDVATYDKKGDGFFFKKDAYYPIIVAIISIIPIYILTKKPLKT